MPQTFPIDLVDMSNAAQPGKRPGRQLRPTLAHSHEVPPHMGPAERQHDQPRLHLRHGFVAGVPIDFQHSRSLWAEMRLRHLVTAAGIEQIDHRVRAENDPQPPAIAFFPVQKHENQPTGFVGLMESALPIPLQQRLVNRRNIGSIRCSPSFTVPAGKSRSYCSSCPSNRSVGRYDEYLSSKTCTQIEMP